jgi:hypothetical protein
MVAFLADFVISILPTFLVSRLFLRLTRGWSDRLVRLVVIHAASLALCVALGTWVFEGIPTYRSVGALAVFAPGQSAWLLVDVFRLVLHRRKAGG